MPVESPRKRGEPVLLPANQRIVGEFLNQSCHQAQRFVLGHVDSMAEVFRQRSHSGSAIEGSPYNRSDWIENDG